MQTKNVKWIFFDVGTTLSDETEAYNHRIRDAIAGTDITFEEFSEKRIFFAKQNLKSDLAALEYFGLEKTPWHREDEKLYPDAKVVLAYLRDKGYNIGVIANQSLGTKDRLDAWGLLKYIDVVAASAELGISKPDRRIFEYALEQADCRADEAVMIGDRLDNDIYPAKKMGMGTIWIKQGIELNGKNISFGDTQQDVIEVLGVAGLTHNNSLHYFENELRFDFNENGKLEFIEFVGGIDGKLCPEMYGIKVFELEAEKVLEIMKVKNNGDIIDKEKGYSYAFLNISVGLYRESIPKNVEEFIAEMRADGVETENNPDVEYERKRANYWATCGIGCRGYYDCLI